MKRGTFGERLTFALDHSGLTRPQFAALLAVDVALMQRELANTSSLPAELIAPQLAKACEILGVKWAWLVEGEPMPSGIAAAKRMRNSAATALDLKDLEKVCDLLEAIT